MNLLVIFAALVLDRLAWNADPYRGFPWFARYWALFRQGPFATQVTTSRVGFLLGVLPPVLLTLWLQGQLDDGWSQLPALAFATAVLLFSLGPVDLGRQGDAYMSARDQGLDTEADQLASAICGYEQAPVEPLRSLGVARCLLVQANQRLFAPIFWFLVLGPAGAVLYRATRLLAALPAPDAGLDETARAGLARLQHLLDWLPSRLTALGYAVTGNFEAVSQAWQQSQLQIDLEEEAPLDEATLLLSATGAAALDSYPSDAEAQDLSETPPVVEDASALIWRALSLWVICIGIGSLIYWIA